MLQEIIDLMNKWEKQIKEYDNTASSSDPEDWMAGHRECLEELKAIVFARELKNETPEERLARRIKANPNVG